MPVAGKNQDIDNVLVVGADRWAYDCFQNYSAYVCQAGRYFRPGATRLGFYKDGAIQPEFPEILARRGYVSITDETAQGLGSSGDPQDAQFAKVVESLIADGKYDPSHQIVLLSPPADPRTMRIAHPIRNTKHAATGRVVAWTRKHDYVPEAAILKEPETTTELDALAEKMRAQSG